MTARDRIVLAVVAVVGILAGSWLLVIQPKRDRASSLQGEITAAQTQLATAQTQMAAGEAAKSSFARDYTAIAKLGEAVPSDDNVPSLIYQLQNAASGARVDFRVLKLVPASGGPSTPAPAPSPSAAATQAPTASAPATQASTANLPPGAAVGPAGFPTLPFTFTFQGNFFHLADFFARLERFVVANNRNVSVSGRLMSLNAISLSAAQQGFPQITATISATTYLVPSAQGLLAGATPSGPANSSTQAASTVGGSTPTSPVAARTPVR
jgi:hypothetical protein